MGKPTKTKLPSKVGAQNGSGTQSSINSFFKKKSEMPSKLFTQVIPSSKGMKPLGAPGKVASLKPHPPLSSASKPSHKRLQRPSPKEQEVPLVIPASPEAMASGTSRSNQGSPHTKEETVIDSPISQLIIPDTPDNVIPKKRPFTSLLNLSKNLPRHQKETASASCEGVYCTMDKKTDSAAAENHTNTSLEKRKSPSAADKVPPSSAFSKHENKLGMLSRKGKKLAHLNGDAAQKSNDGHDENQTSSLSESVYFRGSGLQGSRMEGVEMKPALCRVRNPLRKKTSRLSLSKKVQRSPLSPRDGSLNKRSALPGNSPCAKRFQGVKCLENGVESSDSENIEKVRKSLLEQYAIAEDIPSEGLTFTGDEKQDAASPLTSESGADVSVHIGEVGPVSHTRLYAGGSSSRVAGLGHNNTKEREIDTPRGSTLKVESENDDDFITSIPDSCPMQPSLEYDVTVIPDTCPSMDAAAIQTAPETPNKISTNVCHLDSTIPHDKTSAISEPEPVVSPSINNHNLEVCDGGSDKFSTAEVERNVSAVDFALEHDTDAEAKLKTTCKQNLSNSQTRSETDTEDVAGLKTPPKATMGGSDGTKKGDSPGTTALWEGMDDSFLDGLDLDELDELHNQKNGAQSVSKLDQKFAAMSPFKTKPREGSKQTSQPEWRPSDLCRFTVQRIHENESGSEKTLILTSMTDQTEKTCVLRDTWQQTLVDEGMVVTVHGEFNGLGVCEVTRGQGYIVVNPDHLLTGTAVSNSIRCMRRSVLSEHFKGLERGNRAMLLGSLLHEVFDQAILKNQFQKAQLIQIARDVLMQPAFLCDMYSLKVDEKNLLEDVEEYADKIKKWSDSYLGPTPRGKVDIKWPEAVKTEKCAVSVSRVVDIEETIWSPRWGVKGKVDLTVQVKIHRPSQMKPTQHSVPLELKTGRETNSIEHRSQLILYSLMLGDLEPSPDIGFLLYLKTAAMKAVPANRLDKRELIHLRNQLAYYLSRKARSIDPSSMPTVGPTPSLAPPSLPDPIQDDFTCGRCAHLLSCSLLHKLDGAPTGLSSSMRELFEGGTNHLLDSHIQYFSHWYLLCSLEHEATRKRNNSKNIWCKTATAREQDSECWSNMVLKSCQARDQQHGGYILAFSRKTPQNTGLESCVMSEGDRVVVSEEGTRRVAACVGFIESLSSTEVKISSDSQLQGKSSQEEVVYRIDKDDSYNSMAASLVNLAKLMTPEQTRLRNIIIDKQPPSSVLKPNLPARARAEVASIMKGLNEDQRAAVKAVLRSQDYTLVIGMPGTGKTTTIVALVRILIACDMSVLLTSYTHSAVDNILLKLIQYDVDILRLGAQRNIHPALRRFSDSRLMKKASGVSELAREMERKRVVATTTLGMKHALFSRHSFDVCIVDEASQISQPVCVGALFAASKFVLVGDDRQLPPLVQSTRARNLGMDESLFHRLVTAHNSAAVSLSLQFRMHAEIMSLSNHLVYDGAMKCFSDAVATAMVSLPDWNSWIKSTQADPWLTETVDPQTIVHFLNTDDLTSASGQVHNDNTNRLEASLVRKIVESLLQCGCTADQIGVISPYRRQCQLLTSMLDDLGSKVKSLEVNTVDKYQGRDKDVIVVSFSHSRSDSQGGSILSDLRRLNVSVTRAKHKLLLIGSLKILAQFEPVKKLTDLLQQRNLVRNLPACAAESS